MSEDTPRPTTRDADRIVREVLGDEPRAVSRFATGLCHYVFDVTTESGRRVVVRIAEPGNRHYLEGAVHWSGVLRPKGVPLPDLLHADVDGRTGRFPYMVLERLPGTDLAHVYPKLTRSEKQAIVRQLVEVQRLVGTLPEGTGFGHALSYDKIRYRSWADVINAGLDRAAGWIAAAGVVSPTTVEPLRTIAAGMEAEFAAVRPSPFLDDTTTKNVIVDDGRMSGIVDVDEVCFGDPLFTPALTRMALLASGQDTDYVEFWCDALGLGRGRRRMLTFYTALFCVTFLGELGQRFNANAAADVDEQQIGRLMAILNRLLDELG